MTWLKLKEHMTRISQEQEDNIVLHCALTGGCARVNYANLPGA
jgi:hypothetical protein